MTSSSWSISHEVSRLPVIIRIQEDCTPEIADALDIFHQQMKKRNSDNEIESAMIQALALLQNTLYFEELISNTNDYNQTLAQVAVLFGYLARTAGGMEYKHRHC